MVVAVLALTGCASTASTTTSRHGVPSQTQAAVWSGASTIAPPANAQSAQGLRVSGVACPSSGPCIAVGSFKDSAGDEQPMAVSETGGVWGHASEITLPPNSNPSAGFEGVACAGSASCVAVGGYEDNAGDGQAMVASETGGVWGHASEITPPPNAASNAAADLNRVACSKSGSCVAVGAYKDGAGDLQLMVDSETGGVWGSAIEVTPPPDAESSPSGDLDLTGAACPASGPCVAVSGYKDSSGGEQSMVVTEMGVASQLTAPESGSASVHFDGVACAPSGSCVAVGDYEDALTKDHAMAVSETGGVWGRASEIMLPPNAASNPAAGTPSLKGVACAVSGSCVAVGFYEDSAGDGQAMVVSEKGGTWGPARELAPPANAEHPGAELSKVACVPSGSCVAVGDYDVSSGEGQRPMVVSETGGVWGHASELTLPPDANSNPDASLNSVACSSSGSCAAVGSYRDNAGHGQLMGASRGA